MMIWFRNLAAWFLAIGLAVHSVEAGETRKIYFFGNSLVNHPTARQNTNVPHWLNQIARADGQRFASNGQWGFLRHFEVDHPWVRSWRFPGVAEVMQDDVPSVAGLGFDVLLFNPENFLQNEDPDTEYMFETEIGGTPLSAAIDLLSDLKNAGVNAPVFLYEGWADMAPFLRSFPPGRRELKRYHRYNRGDYHDWYREYEARLALAGHPVRLIPVASLLSGLLQDTPLADLPPEALYLDDAPHGTANLYFLAALICYGPLFDRPLPRSLDLPEDIHPIIQAHISEVIAYISEALPVAKPVQAANETQELGPPRHLMKPAPAQGLKTPALAMGLNGLADWSTQNPFIDVMKSARPWIGHMPGRWGGMEAEMIEASGLLDPAGWPREIPKGIERLEALLLTEQDPRDLSLAGRYRLSYQGNGKVKVSGLVKNIETRPGEIWFDFTPGDGFVGVSILETDPMRSGDYIRNISVMRQELIPLHELGGVFNPTWIDHISDLKLVRFMDWQGTNGSTIERWSERARTEDYTYVRRGAPLDVMLRLAAEIGADPWFNMPHKADDDFVRRFAQEVKSGLVPGRVAYVEYSNEVWNFAFPQSHWAAEQAVALWGESGDGWVRYAGKRAAEVSAIWTEVFGETDRDRLVRVIATQTGWPGLEVSLLREVEDPGASFDAYGITGYFGHMPGMDEMAPTVRSWLMESAALAGQMADQQGLNGTAREAFMRDHGYDLALSRMIAHIRQEDLANLLQVTIPSHARAAAEHDLDLIMYEGGSHLVGHGASQLDEALTEFFSFANYAPEMAGLYDTLISGFTRAGGSLVNVFVDVSAPSKWGSWGTWRYLGDINPRAKRLMRWNATGSGKGDYRQGVTAFGTKGDDVMSGTVLGDYLVGLEGNDVFVVSGPDRIHGGAGYDRVILSGAREAYEVTLDDGNVTAKGIEGTVILREVEELIFDNAPDQPMVLSGLRN